MFMRTTSTHFATCGTGLVIPVKIRVITKTHDEHVNGSVEVLVVIPFRSRLKTSQPLEALWRAICEREFLNSSPVVVPAVIPVVVPAVVPVVSTRVGRF